jgi:DNA replication protein DnaC
VQQILREAFSSVAAAVDAGLLAKSWQQMPIRNIRDEEKELRDLLAAQAAGEMAEALQNQTGIAPDLDLEKYRESLLESHQHLKLELLDPNGSSYKVQLRSVFVPQTVRDCQEYIPQVFEIPKEQLTRLRKEGGLDEAMLDLAEDLIESRRRGYLDQSPRSVLEVVADSRHFHLVILGSPGAGKSTLLKALALE